MTMGSPTLPKSPALPAGLDFFRLRREAIECIGELGSRQWTDYNTHDPGITLLESVLSGTTDVSYRARWEIRDLLAKASDQAFFTARQILTVNPVTPDDYRRLLIDLEGVRNAWVACKECACGEGTSRVRGLYDIRLELDSDDVVGDLNDRAVVRSLSIGAAPNSYEITVEARFPRMELADQAQFDAFMALGTGTFSIECIRFMRGKTGGSGSNALIDDEELRRYWRNVFFATLLVKSNDGSNAITIQDVSIRFFASVDGKNRLRVAELRDLLQNGGESGIVESYRKKERLVRLTLDKAKACYHAHRNLDEDLCRVSVVSVGQVAVCGEIEVAPDADIEWVQAQVWFSIEQYLAPTIPFYSLDELRRAGVAVEDIFDGPPLENGFIKQADLDAATLRSVVRASDIVDRLMDIKGVRSISNLLMTRYDDEGNAVKGVADPAFEGGGTRFEGDRLSASWLLYMGDGQQPRLYHNLSNFKFRKNGLPLTVHQDEAYETLTQLRGEQERPKRPEAPKDLPVPLGGARDAADISPVQYLLPRTYGVSPEGLPTHVGPQRQAQARQLKAYLMVFEQILGNAFEQVAHLGDLFSTNPGIAATYFPHDFKDQIAGYADIVIVTGTGAEEVLNRARLQRLCETLPEFLDRRNAFLDHIMSRFGLNFADYALLLRNWKGDAVAKRELIADKLGVLQDYCAISSGRARAFDHRFDPLRPGNTTVLKQRIALLLGYADLRFTWTEDDSAPPNARLLGFSLVEARGAVWARQSASPPGPADGASKRRLVNAALRAMSRSSAYTLRATEGGYRLVARDDAGVELAEAGPPSRPSGPWATFPTVAEAADFREELIATCSVARSIIVEHLLLRPKFPGDAVYQECGECEDADPWSFRLTVLMPGWTAPYNVALDWRDFANRTIQEEIPSHLLPKVCWVGDDNHEADACDPVVDALTKAIERGAFTAEGARPTCLHARACATAAYDTHAKAFAAWYVGKEHRTYRRQAAATVLAGVFTSITADAIGCELQLEALWNDLREKLVEHFTDVLVLGRQFTRFEQAWYAWLEADSRIDWGEEQLVQRLRALLESRRQDGTNADLCGCAQALLATYGKAFAAWMGENLDLGRELDEFTPFTPPSIALCDGIPFAPGTDKAIAAFLEGRYASYREVSYRLSLLVGLLESLNNTYPAATLHDCEDGNDDNPVRLNQTALGGLSPIAGKSAALVVERNPVRETMREAPGKRRP